MISRRLPALDGALILLLSPLLNRSLESGILPNDVSLVNPLSETLGLCFVSSRVLVDLRWEAVSGGLTTEPIRLPSDPVPFNAVPI